MNLKIKINLNLHCTIHIQITMKITRYLHFYLYTLLNSLPLWAFVELNEMNTACWLQSILLLVELSSSYCLNLLLVLIACFRIKNINTIEQLKKTAFIKIISSTHLFTMKAKTVTKEMNTVKAISAYNVM